jgi:hypothetical protein
MIRFDMAHRLLILSALLLAGCPNTDKEPDDTGDTGAPDDTDTGDSADCTDTGAPVYEDGDGDGYGAGAAYGPCDTPPPHPVDNADDCDDGDAAINPLGTEVCNGADDNCDGNTDEGLGTPWYPDNDGDGFGDDDAGTVACVAPDGHVAAGGDCNDADEAVYPGATDYCSGADEDCDGLADDPMTASWRGEDGTWMDVTSALAAGTPESPAFIGDQPGYAVEVYDGTVYLCAGTWYDKVVLAQLGSELTVVGVYGPDVTALSSGGTTSGTSGSVVAVTDTTLTLEGLTITGGIGSESGTKGGGVAVAQAGAAAAQPNVTLRDSIITGNRTAYGGGVALKDYGTMALYDSLIINNEATAVGGGVWVQTYGALTCEASVLGAAGVVGNTAPIAGGLYFSSKNDGALDSIGCDWGDSGVDDNEPEDIDRQPHADNAWCFGNASALSDTVYCDAAGCTGTVAETCP